MKICPAVDITLSLPHVWVVAPGVLRVTELLLAIIQRRDSKIIDAANAHCEHRRMGVYMSDAIVSCVCCVGILSSVRVRVVPLYMALGLLGMILNEHCCGLWGVNWLENIPA